MAKKEMVSQKGKKSPKVVETVVENQVEEAVAPESLEEVPEKIDISEVIEEEVVPAEEMSYEELSELVKEESVPKTRVKVKKLVPGSVKSKYEVSVEKAPGVFKKIGKWAKEKAMVVAKRFGRVEME